MCALSGGGLPGGFGGLGGMGALGGLEGMGGMGGMDFARLSEAMQQPGMQEAMRGLMSSPGVIDSIASMNPQMRQMLDANPQLR